MIETKAMEDPFQSYVQLAEHTFGLITGGPLPWADPPGVDIKGIYYPNGFEMKRKVIEYILVLLCWVNECTNESFNHESIREKVLETSRTILTFKVGAELGEFRLMLILQLCTLSSVVLLPSPKLLNLLYPIPGKGSSNHLLEVNVDEVDHPDALKCILHCFNFKDYGTNAGERILCETLPGRKVFDVFFPGQSLFLMNASGIPMRKKYLSTTWKTLDDESNTIY